MQPNWSEIHYGKEASLELMTIYLLLLPEGWEDLWVAMILIL